MRRRNLSGHVRRGRADLRRWLGALVLAVAAVPAAATDGFYDPTFGSGGRRLFSIDVGGLDYLYRMRVLADGTLLLGGNCTVSNVPQACFAWYRADGADLNHNYGPGGSGKSFPQSFTGFPAPEGYADWYFDDMAVLADGRVAFVGRNTFGQCYLVMLLANGTDLDRGVGAGKGWAECSYQNFLPRALALQGDGKIVVAGRVTGQSSNFDMTIARWQADLGAFDAQFNGGNPQTIAIEVGGASNDSAEAVLVQPDGRILVAGFAGMQAAFARLLPSGLADNSSNSPGFGFGPLHDGRAHYAFGSAANAYALVLDRSGRIVFGGASDGQWLIGRLLADASAQDPAFNSGAAVVFAGTSGVSGTGTLQAIARQSDGKIVATGASPRSAESSQTYWGAARLLVDGSFDASFGTAGFGNGTFTDASSGCCGYTDSGQAIAVANGGIVVAGSGKATSNGANAFGVARVLLDLVFADRFE